MPFSETTTRQQVSGIECAAAPFCVCVLHNAMLYPAITYPITVLSVTIYRFRCSSIYLNGTLSLFITIFNREQRRDFSFAPMRCFNSRQTPRIKNFREMRNIANENKIKNANPNGNKKFPIINILKINQE